MNIKQLNQIVEQEANNLNHQLLINLIEKLELKQNLSYQEDLYSLLYTYISLKCLKQRTVRKFDNEFTYINTNTYFEVINDLKLKIKLARKNYYVRYREINGINCNDNCKSCRAISDC